MKKTRTLIFFSVYVLILIMVCNCNKGRSPGDSVRKRYSAGTEKIKKTPPKAIKYKEFLNVSIELKQINSLAVSSNSEIFISGDNRILKFSSEGVLQKEGIIGHGGRGLFINSRQEIVCGFKDRVKIFSRDFSELAEWKFKEKNVYIGSVTRSGDFYYIADIGNRRVIRCTEDGKIKGFIGIKDKERGISGFIIPSPYMHVVAGDRGTVWVTNTGRHKIENYRHNGDLISSWGIPSFRPEGFCGCCNPVSFAILSNGSFVTCEKGISRVKIYAPDGEFSCFVAGAEMFTEKTKYLDVAVDSSDRIFILDTSERVLRGFMRKQEIRGN